MTDGVRVRQTRETVWQWPATPDAKFGASPAFGTNTVHYRQTETHPDEHELGPPGTFVSEESRQTNSPAYPSLPLVKIVNLRAEEVQYDGPVQFAGYFGVTNPATAWTVTPAYSDDEYGGGEEYYDDDSDYPDDEEGYAEAYGDGADYQTDEEYLANMEEAGSGETTVHDWYEARDLAGEDYLVGYYRRVSLRNAETRVSVYTGGWTNIAPPGTIIPMNAPAGPVLIEVVVSAYDSLNQRPIPPE